MTVNFDSSSLFSFSADSCCDDDAAAAAGYISKSTMLPNDSRLSYLTVMSEQMSSSRKLNNNNNINIDLNSI